MITFGEKLRMLRTGKNLTQAKMAKQLGISPKAVSRYENGEAEPDFQLLQKMGKMFNVDMNYLLNCPPMKNAPDEFALYAGDVDLLRNYRKSPSKVQKLVRHIVKEFAVTGEGLYQIDLHEEHSMVAEDPDDHVFKR